MTNTTIETIIEEVRQEIAIECLHRTETGNALDLTLLREKLEKVFNLALEKAKEVVPEEKGEEGEVIINYKMSDKDIGHNTCRTQVLDNINKLKI